MSRLAPLLQVFRRSMSAAAARGRPPPRKPNRTDSPPPSTTTAAPAVAAPTDDEVYTILGTKLHIANHPPSVVAALSVDNGSNIEQRRARKQDIIHRFRRSESDTGSPEVQIAILTDNIKNLTTHMIANKKDTCKKRKMSMLVGQRRRMMQYLLRKSPQRYMALIKELGLRPSSVFSKDVPLGAKKTALPILR